MPAGPDRAGPAGAPRRARSATGPFVGRGDELVEARRARGTTRGGATPGAAFIGGEPGRRASRGSPARSPRAPMRAGALVLYGRCDEDLGAPLQPFIEALRTLVPALGPTRLRRGPRRRRARRVVPELAELLPDRAPAVRADPDTERLALFDAVTQPPGARRRASAPVLLVLDDLHWAGKTTLSLLRHLLRAAKGARLLVVGTYRDTELARTHPLAATLADLRRDADAHRISLGGLAADDVDAYLVAVGNDDHALGRELAEVTSGNPFFLIEVLRHVEETGGTWEPGTLPEGVREATGRRLSRLVRRARTRALSVAAVVGHELRPRARRAGAAAATSSTRSRRRASAGLVRGGARRDRPLPVRPRPRPPGAARRARDRQAGAAPPDDRRAARGGAGGGRPRRPARRPRLPLVRVRVGWATRARPWTPADGPADRAMERLAYEEAGDLYGMALQVLDAPTTPIRRDGGDPPPRPLRRAADRGRRRPAPATRSTRSRAPPTARSGSPPGTRPTRACSRCSPSPTASTEIVQSIGAAAGAMRAVGDLQRRGAGPLRARLGARAARADRRRRARARRRPRRRPQRRRPPPRRRDPRRGAAGRPLGPELGDPCQRPLPRRRAGAAHQRRRPGRRVRRAPLPGGARGAAGPRRRGTADDRARHDGRSSGSA